MSNDTMRKPVVNLPKKIKAEHEMCIAAGQEALKHAVTCGKYLTEAKAGIPHGEWVQWVKDNCSFSKKTDEVYRALFEAREELLKESKRATNFSIRGAMSWLKKRRAEAEAKQSQATTTEQPNQAGDAVPVPPGTNARGQQGMAEGTTTSPTPAVATKLVKLMKECHLKGKPDGLLHLFDLLGIKRDAIEKKLAALS